jgi:DinB superfamily
MVDGMAGRRAGTLLVLMERIEAFTLRRAWTQLSDDELFWPPVANAWGVRRRDECRTPTPFGDGDWVADFDNEVALAAMAQGEIEPMTTIGWLLWHIGSVPGRLVQTDFLGGTRTLSSGWTSPYLTHHPVFATASEATETLRAGWNELKAALADADDERMEQPTRLYTYAPEPPRGDGLLALGAPGPEVPAYVPVASKLNEISHHGTQVCVLRDLYRWSPSAGSGSTP